MDKMEKKRSILKSDFVNLQNTITDQAKGIAVPCLQKEVLSEETLITLPEIDRGVIKNNNVFDCLMGRRSRRKLSKGNMSLFELSYLLFLTQGVQRKFKKGEDYQVTIRTVPSAGARHPLETYILSNRIKGLAKGIYRYQPLDHQLVRLNQLTLSEERLTEAVKGQQFIAEANAVFVWSAIPYKTEWRYGSEASKLILLDVGHVCQNLYIATESLGLGTCGIAAYDQDKIDNLLSLDGIEEMVVYLAPVGVSNA